MNAVSLRDLKFDILEPVSYYVKTFNSNFIMSRHIHPYIEVMYCKSETFNFEVYEDNGKNEKTFNTYVISPGEIVVIDAMIPHRIYTDSDVDTIIYNVEFEVKEKKEFNPFGVYDFMNIDYSVLMNKSGWAEIKDEKKGYSILSDISNVEHYFRSFLNTLESGASNLEQMSMIVSRQLMFFSEIGKCKKISGAKGCVIYVKKAQEYIGKNYMNDISIDDISNYVKINKAYLQRLFKQYTKGTILKYINDLRMNKAKQLLEESILSMQSIAEESGFGNRQNLIYEFKKQMSITPSDYRKNYQQMQIDHHLMMHDSKPFKPGQTIK